MNKTLSFICAMALALMLAGCAGTQWNNADTGTVVGGAAGGALGSQIGGKGAGRTIATVVGTLAGAALGNRVGGHFDKQDRNQFGSALESNQTGNTSSWTNPDTNDQYSVTPTQTYTNGNQPCRKFTMNATVNGKPDVVHGTACRQSDGTWKVQS